MAPLEFHSNEFLGGKPPIVLETDPLIGDTHRLFMRTSTEPDDSTNESNGVPTDLDENRLFEVLYSDLKRRAHGQLKRLPPGQTLQPTALVHEAYARLQQKGHRGWENRSQFFAIAVRAMRDVKRGGGNVLVTLNDEPGALEMDATSLLALSDAIDQLEREYPEVAQMVLLRFLAGFTIEEVAELQQVSTRTIERQWRFARAWLQSAMKAD